MTSEPTFTFKIGFMTSKYAGREDSSWSISLDHQCDDWQIAGDEWGSGTSKREAVESLRTFISEAKTTLDALITLPDEPDATLEWSINEGLTTYE